MKAYRAEFHTVPARAVLIARRAMRAPNVIDVHARGDDNGGYGHVVVRFRAADLDSARVAALIVQGLRMDGVGRVRRDTPWPFCGHWSDLNDA